MAKTRRKESQSTKYSHLRRVTKHFWLLFSVALISLGLLFGGYSFITSWLANRDNHAQALQNNQPIQTSTPLISGTPVSISVPSVHIDLKVIPGYYDPSKKSWTLSLDKAQWGVMTAKANNKSGATFIYGHNRRSVFSPLTKIKEGGEAIIKTDNGHTFRYRFVHSSITTPKDTSLLTYTGKPVLVLQTCTGIWYQDRQLFVFDLIAVDEKPLN